jgi:hypothetical protein
VHNATVATAPYSHTKSSLVAACISSSSLKGPNICTQACTPQIKVGMGGLCYDVLAKVCEVVLLQHPPIVVVVIDTAVFLLLRLLCIKAVPSCSAIVLVLELTKVTWLVVIPSTRTKDCTYSAGTRTTFPDASSTNASGTFLWPLFRLSPTKPGFTNSATLARCLSCAPFTTGGPRTYTNSTRPIPLHLSLFVFMG